MRRYSITVVGIVQGVGYRPYVYNQATLFNIKGWVSNQGGSLVMDIEGEQIPQFLVSVIKNPPKLAVIEGVSVSKKDYLGYSDFCIKASSDEKTQSFISPDIATCPECLKELLDPHNRRYHYPFTNCTSCGPRYSIIKQLPYDRKFTTMSNFEMCHLCKEEYENPVDRRFHAQPNGCPQCGPKLTLLNNQQEVIVCEDLIKETIRLLKLGKIIAIKGLGGFHLVCDAFNEQAIKTLRKRKMRPNKPLALMVNDLQLVKKLCFVSDEEETLLTSNKRPVVLLKKKACSLLPDQIAPNLYELGIMLPYTPLHYLLFQDGINVLIMTSGNVSSSPMEYINEEALNELHLIVDYFLIHNRDIHVPVDDSVVKIIDKKEMVLRRARGYTPYTVKLDVKHEIIALGNEQKNTLTISKNGYGYISEYLGDLNDYKGFIHYEQAANHMMNLIGIKPRLIAHDVHFLPDLSMNGRCKAIPIWHHHAHLVSCMVEHHINTQVIGIIFDGTGLGTDGKIWGGEFLVGTRKEFKRVGHLKYVTIQGGETAIKEIWRIAMSYLYSLNRCDFELIKGISHLEKQLVCNALDKKINTFESSSVGRLFDGVASLLNLCQSITYDAEGAILLESILDERVKLSYPYSIVEVDGVFEIEYEAILNELLEDLKRDISPRVISSKFHNTLIQLTYETINKISLCYEIKKVVLSGGVFQNSYLLKSLLMKLRENGLEVYYNQQIPINDGGISIGQLAIANERECEHVSSNSRGGHRY